MTYFPDGSPYTYFPPTEEDDDAGELVCAGWLDGGHPFRTGDPPPGFVDKLAWLCVNELHQRTRGIHFCEICQPEGSRQVSVLVAGEKRRLGTAEIRVRTPRFTYAAPTLVLHYVVDHRYLPPDDFVEAVLAAPESARLERLVAAPRTVLMTAMWGLPVGAIPRGWSRCARRGGPVTPSRGVSFSRRSRVRQPVRGVAHMKAAASVLLLLGVLSCSSATAPELADGTRDPALLQGAAWTLVGFAPASGDFSAARARFTARFGADGRVGGQAGPNVYGGFYTATAEGTIQAREVVSTLIGGPEADQAGKYLNALARAHSFEVTPTELLLRFEERGVLHFRRELLQPL